MCLVLPVEVTSGAVEGRVVGRLGRGADTFVLESLFCTGFGTPERLSLLVSLGRAGGQTTVAERKRARESTEIGRFGRGKTPR